MYEAGHPKQCSVTVPGGTGWGGGEGLRWRGPMNVYGRFMLIFGKNHHNF